MDIIIIEQKSIEDLKKENKSLKHDLRKVITDGKKGTSSTPSLWTVGPLVFTLSALFFALGFGLAKHLLPRVS